MTAPRMASSISWTPKPASCFPPGRSSKPLGRVLTTSNGRPVLIPASQGGGRQWTVHNWWPMSYSSLTGLVYIPSTDRRSDAKAAVEAGKRSGALWRLIAWDPIAETARWSVEELTPSTAACSPRPATWFFRDKAPANLRPMPRTPEKTLVHADEVRDRFHTRHVFYERRTVCDTSVGWGSGSRLFAPARTWPHPNPSAAQIACMPSNLAARFPFRLRTLKFHPCRTAGAQSQSRNCQQGRKTLRNVLLRRLPLALHRRQRRLGGGWRDPRSALCPPEVHKDWYGIVLGGSHWSKGMPGLADPPKFAFPKPI